MSILLIRGSRGAEVKRLKQQLVKLLGDEAADYAGLVAAGDVLDTDVEAAVRCWQAGVGIVADGVVGPRCQELLGLRKPVPLAFALEPALLRQLFPASYIGPDGQTVITVAMQQAAYDAAKLAERKVALTNAARASYAEAIAAGRLVTLPDTTQVRVDLTDSAALHHILQYASSATVRKLISRTGVHAMTVSEFSSITSAIHDYQSALAVRLVEVLGEIGALTTMAAANAYSPVVVVNG